MHALMTIFLVLHRVQVGATHLSLIVPEQKSNENMSAYRHLTESLRRQSRPTQCLRQRRSVHKRWAFMGKCGQ